MSSDVYIDFEKEGLIQDIRIGHLGIMLYFEPFLDWIQQVQEKHPVVTEEVIALLEQKAATFTRTVERIRKMGEQEFSYTFGYVKPVDEQWEDRWHQEEVRNDMEPFLGWNWATRVD